MMTHSLSRLLAIWRSKTSLWRSTGAFSCAVAMELAWFRELDACGGLSYLATLHDELPHFPNVDSHIRIVKGKSVLRRVIVASGFMIIRCLEYEADPVEVLADAERTLLRSGDLSSEYAQRQKETDTFNGSCIRKLWDKIVRRRIILASHYMINRCFVAGEDPFEILSDAEEVLLELGEAWATPSPTAEDVLSALRVQRAQSVTPPAEARKPDMGDFEMMRDNNGEFTTVQSRSHRAETALSVDAPGKADPPPNELPGASASPESNIDQVSAETELPSQRKGTPSQAPDLKERKAAYDAYKRKCKDAGVKMTEKKLARANPSWNTRDPVVKWKEGKDRPADDRLIRRGMGNLPPANRS